MNDEYEQYFWPEWVYGRCRCGDHPKTFKAAHGHSASHEGPCYVCGEVWPCRATQARHLHEVHGQLPPGVSDVP